MKHLRVIAASLIFAIAGMMFVSPASSQISIRVNPEHREGHHVYYYHHRHGYYRHRDVVYQHRRVVYHHRREGIHVRLNVR